MAESVLKAEAQVNKGANARMSSFVGALAIADLVKTTLGPKGMDKILQQVSSKDGKVTITNDGATILKSVPLDNAAAKCLVNIAKIQDEEVGDGTTSVVVLTGEMLREAEDLMKMRIHPMTIVEGWRIATDAAQKALEASAIDNSADDEVFKQDLMNIASTTLSSKLLSSEKNHFAQLAVDAILKLRESKNINLELIQILKVPGGSLHDSFVDEGFILNKKIGVGQPKRIENAKILIANTAMDTDKIKIFGSQVKVDSLDKVAAIEEAEKNKMRKKCEKIIDHGINCFINRQLIYNFPEQIFADAGIMAIEHADFIGTERLAAVTGGEITSTFDHPEGTVLGTAELIEEIMIGEKKMIKFSGVGGGKACSIILRGASSHILAEAERSLHDALCVLQQTILEPRITLGGGCAECLMAKAVDEMVPKTSGKKALAVEAFARALRQMPAIISDNAGYDSAELVAQLRNAHFEGKSTYGLNMTKGTVGCMKELGITEPFKLKRQVLLSSAEAAEMILRVDEIVKCAPRQRNGGGHGHGC